MTDQTVGVSPQMEGGQSFTGGGFYEIKVYGQMDQDWAEWLGGLRVTPEGEGNTLLSGIIPDQAALHGLLVKIRDLGLPILSLQRLEE